MIMDLRLEDKSDMAALRVAISLLMAARDTGRSIGLQPHQTIARGQDLSPCKSPRRLTLPRRASTYPPANLHTR